MSEPTLRSRHRIRDRRHAAGDSSLSTSDPAHFDQRSGSQAGSRAGEGTFPAGDYAAPTTAASGAGHALASVPIMPHVESEAGLAGGPHGSAVARQRGEGITLNAGMRDATEGAGSTGFAAMSIHGRAEADTLNSTGDAAAQGQLSSIVARLIQRHPEGAGLSIDADAAVAELQGAPAPGVAAPAGPSADGTQATAAPAGSAADGAQADGAQPLTQAPAADISAAPAQTGPTVAPPAPTSSQAMSLSTAQSILQASYGNIHQIVPGSIVQLADRTAIWAKYDQVCITNGVTNPYVQPARPWQAGDAQQYIPGLDGFADAGTVYVNAQTTLATATAHEMLHLNTAADFRGRVGETINEGATEYLAIKALTAASVSTASGTAYPGEVDLIRTLIGLVGEGTLIQAYFNGGSAINELMGAIDTSQGEGTFLLLKQYGDAKDFARAQGLLKPGGGTQQTLKPANDSSEVTV